MPKTVLDTFPKQPSEVMDYDISFVEWLADRGNDTIIDSSVDISPAGELQLVASSVNSGIVKLWFSGGVNKKKYYVSVKVETAGGRTKEADIAIDVKELG